MSNLPFLTFIYSWQDSNRVNSHINFWKGNSGIGKAFACKCCVHTYSPSFSFERKFEFHFSLIHGMTLNFFILITLIYSTENAYSVMCYHVWLPQPSLPFAVPVFCRNNNCCFSCYSMPTILILTAWWIIRHLIFQHTT